MVSYTDFKQSHIGRSFNIDGAFGAQCWDAYAKYCIYLGVPYANCTTSGYAKDIWEARHRNGVLNHFIEVAQPQPGDVAVFKNHGWTPDSHIAIYDGDAGGGFGFFLSQNQGGTPAPGGGSSFNVVKFPYDALYPTYLRPKALASAPQASGVNWVRETGTMTTHHAIYARENGPSTRNRSPYMFPAGSAINYDAYCHAEGYIWIRQRRSGGGYWYIPTGSSNGARRTEKAWGEFK